jgi:hypothetical protein
MNIFIFVAFLVVLVSVINVLKNKKMSYELGKEFNTRVGEFLRAYRPNTTAPFRNFAQFYTYMCKMFGYLRSKLIKSYPRYLAAWAKFLCANSYPVVPSAARLPPAFVEEEYLSRRYYATFVLPIQYCSPDMDMFASFERRFVPRVGDKCFVTALKNPRASQRSCGNAFHEPQWMDEKALRQANPQNRAFVKQLDAYDIKTANEEFSAVMFPTAARGGRRARKRSKTNSF